MPTKILYPQQFGSLTTYDDVVACGNASGNDEDLIYCVDTKTIYEYIASGAIYVIDGTTVLSTAIGGDTRWIAIAGTYSVFGGGLKTYETVADAQADSGADNDLMFCVETESIYRYEETGASYSADSTTVLTTGDAVNTRWLAVAGKYSAVRFKAIEREYKIEDWNDSLAPPAGLETIISGNGVMRVRKFSSATSEDVVMCIKIPELAVQANGFKFKVTGIISDAAPAGAEGVMFKCGAYSIADGVAINAAFSADVKSEKALDATFLQYDSWESDISATITPTNDFIPGDKLMIRVYRDHSDAGDIYLQDIAVSTVILTWTETP